MTRQDARRNNALLRAAYSWQLGMIYAVVAAIGP